MSENALLEPAALLQHPVDARRGVLHVVRDGNGSPAGQQRQVPLRFGVLGPLEVTDEPRVLDLGAPKQRAVLAVLLLNANTVVSLDRLVDQLWGEEPPPQAVGSLQAYIYNLRRILEPDRARRAPARRLVSKAPGYMLVVDPTHYDAARFQALAASGQQSLRDGQPRAATETLNEALGLWRGPALAEFAFESFAQAEAARLEELRAVALEDRVEADLALGHHARAVAELERLVARYPLRERLWGALMVALYRSGRQGEALRSYQNCRATLVEELGIDPGPTLRQLEHDILAQAPSLDWRSPAQDDPAPPLSVRLNRTVGAHDEGESGSMVGRAEPLQQLGASLDRALAGQGGMVLIAGEAGIGKTRLIEELARRAGQRGAQVAWGRCHEGEEAPALWPWVQVLRGAGLAPLPPTPPGPGEARCQLFQAVAAALLSLADPDGLVLVLDDLQWADEASLQLLRFLVGQLPAAPLLVVAAYRDGEVDSAHPLAGVLGSLARQRMVERVTLSGLGEAEVGELIATITGTEPAPAVVTTVRRRTEGNPFFLTELVQLLHGDGALDTDDIEAAGSSRVPAGVRDVVRQRLARLPQPTGDLVAAAAVVGAEFDASVLAAMAELDGEAALERLEPALISGVVVEQAGADGGYRFSNALVREAVYADLRPLRRTRLQARASALSSPGRPG